MVARLQLTRRRTSGPGPPTQAHSQAEPLPPRNEAIMRGRRAPSVAAQRSDTIVRAPCQRPCSRA